MAKMLLPKPPESYRQDLARALGHDRLAFVCPICREEFIDADEARRALCKAHIIPEGLGGEKTTLVCKSCDHSLGAQVEGPVISFINDYLVIHGRKPGIVRNTQTKLETEHGTEPCQVSLVKGKGWHINLPRKGGASAMGNLRPGPIGEDNLPPRIRVSYRFNHRRLNAAIIRLMLKASLLAAFELLGYVYVLRRDVAWVGSHILDPHRNPAPYWYIFFPDRDKFPNEARFDASSGLAKSQVVVYDGAVSDDPALLCCVDLHGIPGIVVLPSPQYCTLASPCSYLQPSEGMLPATRMRFGIGAAFF